jgi:hypothetical protein
VRSSLNPNSPEAGDPYFIGDIYARLRSNQQSLKSGPEVKGYLL